MLKIKCKLKPNSVIFVDAKSQLSPIQEVVDDPDSDPEESSPCSPGFLTSASGVTVELLGQDLWKKFHKLGTEMIITKAGR